MDGEDRDGAMVVVPHAAGPLIRPDEVGRRRPDDLDTLIDDLLPSSDGGPTWFDGVLLAGGAGLLIWALVTGGPAAAVVIAVIMLTLGCMLPLRSAAHRMGERRRAAAVAQGVPLRVDDRAAAELVEAYESLLALPAVELPALSAAHAAVLEAATLLDGHVIGTQREREYVAVRTQAIRRLTQALQAPQLGPSRSEAVLDARVELDVVSGGNALTRLDDLTAEARGGESATS